MAAISQQALCLGQGGNRLGAADHGARAMRGVADRALVLRRRVGHRHGFLDPEQVELGNLPHQVHGHRHVEAGMTVDDKVGLGPDRATHGGDAGEAGVEQRPAFARRALRPAQPVEGRDLDRPIAAFADDQRRLGAEPIGPAVGDAAVDVGVAGHRVAPVATQQHRQRQPRLPRQRVQQCLLQPVGEGPARRPHMGLHKGAQGWPAAYSVPPARRSAKSSASRSTPTSSPKAVASPKPTVPSASSASTKSHTVLAETGTVCTATRVSRRSSRPAECSKKLASLMAIRIFVPYDGTRVEFCQF